MSPISAASAPAVRQVRASIAQETRWRGSAFELVNRVYRLRGELNHGALRTALGTVVRRHEALRCGLHDEGRLMMRVSDEVSNPLRTVTAPGKTPEEREAWLDEWLGNEINTPFDRGRPPLLRATLIRLGPTDHVFVLVIDHIIADGWSVDLLARELGAWYAAEIGAPVPAAGDFPGQVQQYPDWVSEERANLTEQRLAERMAFWNDQFPAGPKDVAVWLSGYRGGDPGNTGPARLVETVLGEEVTAGLRRMARSLQVTLFVLTATVLVRLLQKDTGQQRITLSTSSAARFSQRTANMIGYLATTIWVPTTLSGATDLGNGARAFHRDLIDAMAQSDLPARMVFERLWGPGARDRMNAVPQVDFLCTHLWGESLVLPGIEVTASEYEDGGTDGALSVYLADRGPRIEIQVRFAPGTLEDGYAERLLDGYVADLVAVADRSL